MDWVISHSEYAGRINADPDAVRVFSSKAATTTKQPPEPAHWFPNGTPTFGLL